MKTTFTFPADTIEEMDELADRLDGIIIVTDSDDRIERGMFHDVKDYGVRLITSDPVRMIKDLEDEGFLD